MFGKKKVDKNVVVDYERIAELERKKKELTKEKKIRNKAAEKQKKRAMDEAHKRELFILIQSTQLSVPISDVLRGVIITKDKRYLKIMEFSPQNFLMFSSNDRNKIASDFMAMLKVIPAKAQFKVFSRKAKIESLLETMSKSHETETNASCLRMQEEYMELIKDTALREGVTRRFFIIIEHSDDVETDGTNFHAVVASLNQTAARVRNYMEQAGNFYVSSCEQDYAVTELLYEILNRRASETIPFSDRASKVYDHYIETLERKRKEEIIAAGGRVEDLEPLKVPPIPATEFVAPAWIDYKHARHMVVDDKFYTFGFFTGTGFPNYVVAGWLSSFINACEGVDIDIFMERVPKHKVEGSIGRRIRNNRAKLKETADTSTEATSVENLVQSGFYLLNGLANGEEFYYVNVLITVTGDNLKDVNYRYNELEKMAHSMSIKMRRATFQMEDAFVSTLPLCKISKSLYKKSRRNMLSSGASSFYPFISFELQDPNGIMLGVNKSNNSLVAVDVFDTSRHANANGAILGKSGYGKTFTAQLLAIRMRLQNIQTFIITPLKGREDYKRACDQIDGQYVALGPGSPYAINIFDIYVPDTSGLEVLDGYDAETSLLAKKVQDLHTFFHLVVRDLSQEEEQILDSYLYKVYNKFGITEDNNSLYVEGTTTYKEFPLLGDLHSMISTNPRLQRVANILEPLVSGSLSVYNRHTNVDLSNKYIVFDMNGTKGMNLILSMFITLDFVWSKIKQNRLEKKAVFIDEAWQLIGNESNEMAAEYVKEIFKTIRAFGGSAFVMTQEVSDFFSLKGGEYGKAIIGNADTKVILHLDNTEANMVQEIMSLTSEEYKSITQLPRGQGLVATGNSKLFVDFKASPFEVEVITTDPAFLRKKRRELEAAEAAQKELDAINQDVVDVEYEEVEPEKDNIAVPTIKDEDDWGDNKVVELDDDELIEL